MGHFTPRSRTPLTASLILSAGYMALCGLYILLSSHWAGQISTSVTGLQRLETIKGMIFILVTGIFFLLFSWYLYTKIGKQKEELLKMKRVVMESENRALAGIFASSVAHDINNVLCMFDTEELQETIDKENIRTVAVIDRIKKAYQLLSGLSLKLHQIGNNKDYNEKVDFDLNNLIRETVDFARIHRKIRQCKLQYAPLNQSLPFRGNPFIIQRALINLVLNAAEASGERGVIAISLAQQSKALLLEVSDNGPGVPENKRDDIFTAFFTTKSSGSGLGLISVKACSEIHSGTVTIGSSALGGASFRISLPVDTTAS